MPWRSGGRLGFPKGARLPIAIPLSITPSDRVRPPVRQSRALAMLAPSGFHPGSRWFECSVVRPTGPPRSWARAGAVNHGLPGIDVAEHDPHDISGSVRTVGHLRAASSTIVIGRGHGDCVTVPGSMAAQIATL